MLDGIAVCPSQRNGLSHCDASVGIDNAEQFLGERGQRRHQVFLLNLAGENILLLCQTADEEGDPLVQLRLISVQSGLRASQGSIVFILVVFHDPLERATGYVAIVVSQ